MGQTRTRATAVAIALCAIGCKQDRSPEDAVADDVHKHVAVGVETTEDTAALASAKETLSVSFTNLTVTTYKERNSEGRLVHPANRVMFGEAIQSRSAATATVGEEEISCPPIFQDIAYAVDDQGVRGDTIIILGYQGCPFTVNGPLEVRTDFEMREEITLEIEKASNNLLWPSSSSSLPVVFQGQQFYFGVEMLINMTWIFKHAGMKFAAADQEYVTEKAGAKIRFTRQGIVLDGVSRKK